MPRDDRNFSSVIRVFEAMCDRRERELFEALEREKPGSYAAALYRRSRTTQGAEKMHSSITGIVAANLLPLSHKGAIWSFQNPEQVDFASFGRERRALFVTMDDLDHSLAALTSLFVKQAISSLCDAADANPSGRLDMPVRLVLDDFANLDLPGIDDALAVIRSREISCTIVCQTVSQLEARYGEANANSIIGNCDRQLVTAFQDERTARYFSIRANKPASSLLETPSGQWWLFERGHRGVMDEAYHLEEHPAYQQLTLASGFEVDARGEDFFEEIDPSEYEKYGFTPTV